MLPEKRIYLYIGTGLELLHIAITDINQLITLNFAREPNLAKSPAKQAGGQLPACLMLFACPT
jgi:hypothetical protein